MVICNADYINVHALSDNLCIHYGMTNTKFENVRQNQASVRKLKKKTIRIILEVEQHNCTIDSNYYKISQWIPLINTTRAHSSTIVLCSCLCFLIHISYSHARMMLSPIKGGLATAPSPRHSLASLSLSLPHLHH